MSLRFALSIACSLGLSASLATAGTVTSNPVSLQDGSCPSSNPSDGSTAHALYEYQITQSGTVLGIKLLYADVKPPERRAALLAQFQACLAGWRFRPATVDGAPAAALMKASFHRLQPAAGPEVRLPGGAIISVAALSQIRAATLAFTETLLAGKGYLETRGDGWLLRTDLPKTTFDDIQRALDFARAAFSEAFPGRADRPASADQPGPQDVTIILFKDQEKYQELSAFDNLIPDRAPVAGQYNPQMKIIYAAQGDQPMPIFSRLIAHETTHHFAQLRLARPDSYVPIWLNEGIAEFVGSIKMAKPGKIRLDALDRGIISQPAAILTRDDTLSGERVWLKNAEESIHLLAENLGEVDLEALFNGALDRHFRDNEMRVHYAVSWLVVHSLLTGEGGRYRDAFRVWATNTGAERNAATLGAALGITMPELRRLLEKHLKEIQ
jgi:hypothetical protein